jgi:hypothetical protein
MAVTTQMVAALVRPVTAPSGVEDGARADEAHAGEDLRGQAARVAPALGQADGEHGEEDGRDADEDVGTQARGLALELALDADGAAQKDREQELDQELEVQGGVQVGGDHGLVPVRTVTLDSGLSPPRPCPRPSPRP